MPEDPGLLGDALARHGLALIGDGVFRPFHDPAAWVKPMTVTVAQGAELVRLAQKTGRICAVNDGYTGYALVLHLRVVVAEFAHGHHADAAGAANPRVRWRHDPAPAGISAQFADCSIHALHMASYVTGQEVERLSADITSSIASRQLEDDAMVNFRMSGGTVRRLRTLEAKATGRPKLTAPAGLPSAMPKGCYWHAPISTAIWPRRSAPAPRAAGPLTSCTDRRQGPTAGGGRRCQGAGPVARLGCRSFDPGAGFGGNRGPVGKGVRHGGPGYPGP